MKKVSPLLCHAIMVCLFICCGLATQANNSENLRFESCPSDIVATPITGLNLGVVQWVPPTVVGGVGIVNVTKTHRPGSSFPLGITTVTYTATDLAGNQAFCSFQVNVTNEPPPVDSIRSDSVILVDLYNKTDGRNWTIKWDLSRPMDEWYGVDLNDEGRVSLLTLKRNNLKGRLPSDIGNLEELLWLDLEYNEISGFLPESIVRLSNLGILNLGQNDLTGSLPESIGNLKKLKWLILQGNNLSGEIPKRIGELQFLEILSLENNNLSGNIELTWEKMKFLARLHLSNNQLSGIVPANIGRLRAVGHLDLSRNNFTGQLPEEIGNLNKLWNLRIFGNKLSGKIPESIGQLNNLSHLVLSTNQFTGSIPESIGNLRRLVALNLSNNQLSGSIPDVFAELENLERLEINTNQLTGSIPTSIYTGASNLTRLDFARNQLSGIISPMIVQLTKLEHLNLQSNLLEGNIPENIGALTNLEFLYLGRNQLTGSIPPSLGRLTGLEQLSLVNNNLSGCYAKELRNLCSVPNIFLGGNENLPNDGNFGLFCENGIGTCVGNSAPCRAADSLTLVAFSNQTGRRAWNKVWDLEAPIDTWHGVTLNSSGCVVELDLSSNNLLFQLPEEIANLESLEVLNLSNNRLDGSVPTSIKNKMRKLKILNLSHNYFTLFSLWNFTNLDSLKVLDLSDNRLNFNLPDKLDDLPSLKKLYLQNNNFSGCFKEEWKTALCELGFAASKEEDGYNFTNNPDLPNSGDFQAFCEGVLEACENNLNSRRQDSLALVDFYYALDGPNWIESWNLSEPLENWNGIFFFNVNNIGRVSDITLKGNGLKGEIPSTIDQLFYLESLNLPDNQISGAVPTTTLTNRILNYIGLTSNEITTIPEEISNLQKLWKLDLSNNRIDTITSSIANIRTLVRLNLSGNNITTIPEELGKMRGLYELNLSSNEINTTFPDFLLEMSSLGELRLSNCGFTGEIPSEIAQLSRLRTLELHENNFTGSIPSGLTALWFLERLRLNNNQLGGELEELIPEELLLLELIDFSNNQLEGCFPENYSVYCDNEDIEVDFSNNNLIVPFETFCEEGESACLGGYLQEIVRGNRIQLNETLMKVAPNPTSGNLNLSFNLTEASILKVINMQGKVVEFINLKSGIFDRKINLEHLQNGIYYVQINTQNEIFSQKIVLMK